MSDTRAYLVTVALGLTTREEYVESSDVVEAVTMAIVNAFGTSSNMRQARCLRITRTAIRPAAPATASSSTTSQERATTCHDHADLSEIPPALRSKRLH